MAAKSRTRRAISGKIAAIERHNGPDDPRLTALKTAGAALAIGEIAEWAQRAAAALPVFDQAEIGAAGRAAARIDARLVGQADDGDGAA